MKVLVLQATLANNTPVEGGTFIDDGTKILRRETPKPTHEQQETILLSRLCIMQFIATHNTIEGKLHCFASSTSVK